MTELHHCALPRNEKPHYGMEAVTECDEMADGTFHVGNGEYSNPVNFCPECGKESPAHLRQRLAESWRGNPA
jgi:hypothetical protein